MPIALLIEIIQAMAALAPEVPAVLELGASAVALLQTGTVTPQQEASIRAQLDAVKAAIDAA